MRQLRSASTSSAKLMYADELVSQHVPQVVELVTDILFLPQSLVTTVRGRRAAAPARLCPAEPLRLVADRRAELKGAVGHVSAQPASARDFRIQGYGSKHRVRQRWHVEPRLPVANPSNRAPPKAVGK
jgi:hypothetical protein